MQNEINSLSRKLKAVYLIFGGLLLLQTAFFFGTKAEAGGDKENQIVRTRGIIIVDEKGRERVLIGAPIPASKHRVFSDKSKALAAWKDKMPENVNQFWDNFQNLNKDAVGMIVLDENGFDRLSVGDQLPDPNSGKRIGTATGMAFNNNKGYERGGFGIIDVGGSERVNLGMDSPTGEALTLSVIDGKGMGIRINDRNNQIFLGNLPAKTWENQTDQNFSGYMFRQNGEIKNQLNTLAK